ncbi:MAG TPA: hypothetical protein VJM31_17240 [Vicinamibacterales bacterium]|nr:hypothetical protein [Vicinamibacterales bacterium]
MVRTSLRHAAKHYLFGDYGFYKLEGRGRIEGRWTEKPGKRRRRVYTFALPY